MNEDMRFVIVNDKGEEIECVGLFSFEMNGQEYLVYTDQTRTPSGELNITAGIMHDGQLLPVESPEEWAVIEEELNKLIAQMKEED